MFARLLAHIVWVVFVLLVLIGLSIHGVLGYLHVPHEVWPWTVLSMLADGLIVAGILGATVDWALKRALVRDVGSIFIGWALPQEVRDYIRHVSETSLVRSCRLHYVLTVRGDDVIVDVTDECDVFNYSSGVRKYRPRVALDRCEHPDESAVEYQITRGGRVKRYTVAELQASKQEMPQSIRWRAPNTMVLAPQNINQTELKPACRTRWKYRLRLPKDYTTIAAFGTPTLGVTVTVDWPREVLDVLCKDPTEHAPGSNVWQYDRLFMEGHVRLYWFPKAN